MLRLVSDEDVHDDIIRGLRRRERGLDIVRVLDVGLDQTPDPDILEWAANQERIVVTGDLNTMVGFAWARRRVRNAMQPLSFARQSPQSPCGPDGQSVSGTEEEAYFRRKSPRCTERPPWRSANWDSTLRRPPRNATEGVPYRAIRRAAFLTWCLWGLAALGPPFGHSITHARGN